MTFMLWDRKALDWWCQEVGTHFESSSPVVVIWLDQALERVDNGTITLRELIRLQRLTPEPGQFLQANHAGRMAYEALIEFGILPDGVTGAL